MTDPELCIGVLNKTELIRRREPWRTIDRVRESPPRRRVRLVQHGQRPTKLPTISAAARKREPSHDRGEHLRPGVKPDESPDMPGRFTAFSRLGLALGSGTRPSRRQGHLWGVNARLGGSSTHLWSASGTAELCEAGCNDKSRRLYHYLDREALALATVTAPGQNHRGRQTRIDCRRRSSDDLGSPYPRRALGRAAADSAVREQQCLRVGRVGGCGRARTGCVSFQDKSAANTVRSWMPSRLAS